MPGSYPRPLKPNRRPRRRSGRLAELVELAALGEQAQRLLFDAARALVLGKLADHLADALVAERGSDLLVGLRPIARQQVAEGGVTVLADRLVEAGQMPRNLAGFEHELLGKLRLDRDLGVGRVATELLGQLLLGLADLALALA